MTYRDLVQRLQTLSEEQLDMDVTVWQENGEFVPVFGLFETADEADVLDANHPYLSL